MLLFFRFPFPVLGSFMGKSPEEIQKALELYQSHLARLQKDAIFKATLEPKQPKLPQKSPDPIDQIPDESKHEETKENPTQKTVSPFVSPSFPLPTPGNLQSSPLQGMASITNALTQQSRSPTFRPIQRTFKPILPPITQDQFDRFGNINTEEVVRKVCLFLH